MKYTPTNDVLFVRPRAVPNSCIARVRAVFADDTSVADLDQAMDAIPAQLEQGFTTFCLKPSQFTDDPDGVAALCLAAYAIGAAAVLAGVAARRRHA